MEDITIQIVNAAKVKEFPNSVEHIRWVTRKLRDYKGQLTKEDAYAIVESLPCVRRDVLGDFCLRFSCNQFVPAHALQWDPVQAMLDVTNRMESEIQYVIVEKKILLHTLRTLL